MDEAANKINLFTTRVRQLILRMRKIEGENVELRGKMAERDERIKELEQRLGASEASCQRLRTARLLEIADGDVETARRRVATLIRSVNKCITLLSEK